MSAYFYKSSPSKCLNTILSDSDISMQNVSELSMYSAASIGTGQKMTNTCDLNIKKISEYSYHFSGYLKEILVYMYYLEAKHKVNGYYMESRACNINPNMRKILVL